MGTSLAVTERQQQLAVHDPFQPQNMEELMKLANVVSDTDFAPKDFKGKPHSCFVAMLYGRQLGVEPLQAIQNIYVINGRPTLFGDLLWALIVSHPDFVDAVEDVNETRAIVTLTRRNRTPNTVEFSQADATKAGLWNKTGPWTTAPKRMMLFRARTFAARNLFPDALKGITSREEAEDFIEGEVIAQPEIQPKGDAELERAKARTAAAAAKAAFVTDIQVKEWNKARKDSGKTTEDARMYILETFNITRSGEIPVDRFEEAMDWARSVPAEGKTKDEVTGNEKAVRAEMERRQMLPFEQAGVIANHTNEGVTDWPAVMAEIQA